MIDNTGKLPEKESALVRRGRKGRENALMDNEVGVFKSSGIKTKKEATDQRDFLKKLSTKMMHVGVKANKFQPHFREQIL